MAGKFRGAAGGPAKLCKESKTWSAFDRLSKACTDQYRER